MHSALIFALARIMLHLLEKQKVNNFSLTIDDTSGIKYCIYVNLSHYYNYHSCNNNEDNDDDENNNFAFI
jgi:hypothetical protein